MAILSQEMLFKCFIKDDAEPSQGRLLKFFLNGETKPSQERLLSLELHVHLKRIGARRSMRSLRWCCHPCYSAWCPFVAVAYKSVISSGLATSIIFQEEYIVIG